MTIYNLHPPGFSKPGRDERIIEKEKDSPLRGLETYCDNLLSFRPLRFTQSRRDERIVEKVDRKEPRRGGIIVGVGKFLENRNRRKVRHEALIGGGAGLRAEFEPAEH
jgi:hypothetical protein